MSTHPDHSQNVEILLVEDNPGDIELTQEAFRAARIANRTTIVRDGAEAIDYLYKRGKFADAVRPDIIMLDLNMPKRGGKEVLEIIREDIQLMHIPVVILSSSAAEQEVLRSFHLNANAYIIKPVDFKQFLRVIQGIDDFWLNIVKLPRRTQAA